MCWLLYKELKNIIIIGKQNFRQKGPLWIRSSIDRFMKFIFTNMYNYNSRLKVKAIIWTYHTMSCFTTTVKEKIRKGNNFAINTNLYFSAA